MPGRRRKGIAKGLYHERDAHPALSSRRVTTYAFVRTQSPEKEARHLAGLLDHFYYIGRSVRSAFPAQAETGEAGETEAEAEQRDRAGFGYRLGYFNRDEDRVEPSPNPFAPDTVLTMCPE